MKKKISLILCVLAALLCFTGCGSKANADVEYDKASMEEVTKFLIDYCANADDATVEQWKSMSEFAMEQQFAGAGLPFSPESFLNTLDVWATGEEEYGDYVSSGKFEFEASSQELKIVTKAKFEERDADITFIFKADLRGNLNLDSMTIDGHYSTGEILKKAGMNTVLGMGTVFVVLIFISLIISLFRFIPAIQNAFSGKSKQTAEVQSVTEVTASPAVSAAVVEQAVDDTELIAVISAAIAAAEGTTTDGFVVRSIRRRPSNKWN